VLKNGSNNAAESIVRMFCPVFESRVPQSSLKPFNRVNTLNMRQLQPSYSAFSHPSRPLLFLTRRQIERVLTLPTNTTNKGVVVAAGGEYWYGGTVRIRSGIFQTPLYYLGALGWHVVGNPMDDYKSTSSDSTTRRTPDGP